MKKSTPKIIAKQIKEAKKILIFHHVRPDGDSLSCSYGLLQAIKKRFPRKIVKWVADKEFIERKFPYLQIDFKDAIQDESIDESWMGIIGDNAVLKRTYNYFIFNKTGTKICFDHHQNDIDYKADFYYKDATLGAAAVQAFYITQKLKVKYNSRLAIFMLFGILTDTNFFRFSIADARPLEAAGKLLKFIYPPHLDALYKEMNQKSDKDLKIQTYALNNYKIEKGIAFCKWTLETQKKLKITSDDCARVNLISNLKNAEVWLFLIENVEDNNIRIEFRSAGLPVNLIATKFGGGGHQRAAGAKIKRDWNLAEEVIQETQKKLLIYKKEKA